MRDLVRLSLLAHFALLIMSVLWLRLEYPYKRQVCTAGVEISSQNAVPVFSTPSHQCTDGHYLRLSTHAQLIVHSAYPLIVNFFAQG